MNYLHSGSIRLKTKGRLSVNYWTFFGLCLYTSPFCHKLFQSFSYSPDLSLLYDWLHCDRHISHSQDGKRHVDRGLCPEIKQYAVTEKKQTDHSHIFSLACMPTWQSHCDLTSKKTNNADRKRPPLNVASQSMEPQYHMGSSLLTKQPWGQQHS